MRTRLPLGCFLRRFLLAGSFGLLLAVGATVSPTAAAASVTPTSSASDLAGALAVNSATITSATFTARPSGGNPTATTPGFGPIVPVDGQTMAVLSTGDATAVDSSNKQSDTVNTVDGGSDVRGAHDVTVLRLKIRVPPSANCLMLGFDFFTEEMPEANPSTTHGNFLDGFIAELDPTLGWGVGTNPADSSPINTMIAGPGQDPAPSADFALGDIKGDVVDGYLMARSGADPSQIDPYAAAAATGTPYNGATGWRFAHVRVSAGVHTVDLSLYDKGDSDNDSAVLLDGLRLLRRTPATCTRESADFREGDVVAPTVGLRSPAQGTKTSNPKPRFAGAAGTAAGDGGVKVRVYSGPGVHGTPVATLNAIVSGASWAVTSSTRLATGVYTAQAEQVDSSGNLGLSSTRTFAVVPGTKITAAKIRGKHHRARFSFKAVGHATGFQCALAKSGARPKFSSCNSPRTYEKLKTGKYTFQVRALSHAGPGPVATKSFQI